jgi:ClpP class serine protease
MSFALRFIESRQWAILDDYLLLMAAIADRDLDNRDSILQAIEKQWGRPIPNTAEATVRNGVAIIPVAGPLFRYANLFTSISGATSFERLSADIGTVMANPNVHHVIYDINSPGGEVDGVAETAELIYGFRGVKPQTAYVSHLGTSAAYWLAAAADEIVASKTSMLGSIGAVLSVVDRSAQDEEVGIKRMEFVSSVSPDKRVDPFSDDADEAARARVKIQGLVDRIGNVFVEVVASYRGVEESAITRHKGGLLLGADAVDGGLADGLGTLEGLIEAFSGGANLAPANSQSLAAVGLNSNTGDGVMNGEQGTTLKEIVVDLDFLASNHPDLLREVRATAAAEERERILRIHALDAAGFEEIKLGMMQDPSGTAGKAAEAILAAKGEQEKRKVQTTEQALEADEGDLEGVAATTVTSDEEVTEEQIAASVIRHFPQAATG